MCVQVADARFNVHPPPGNRCATTATSPRLGCRVTLKVSVSCRAKVTPENVTSIPVPAAVKLLPNGSAERTGQTVTVPWPRNAPRGPVTIPTPGTITRNARDEDTTTVTGRAEAARCGPLPQATTPGAAATTRAITDGSHLCRRTWRQSPPARFIHHHQQSCICSTPVRCMTPSNHSRLTRRPLLAAKVEAQLSTMPWLQAPSGSPLSLH